MPRAIGHRFFVILIGLIGAAAIAAPSAQRRDPANRTLLLNPDSPEMNRRAPNVARVRLETTRGVIRLELHRAWAPRGVDRFYNLVSHGYYDHSAVFRIIAGKWAQFGINGDPKIAQLWRTRTIPDDPKKHSNVRGTVTFAFAEPNGRATQVYFALADLSDPQDAQGFVPFGEIVGGMDTADAL